MKPGDVFYVPFPVADNPGKKKIAICIDPQRGYFFFINTRPPRFPQAGVYIARADLPKLAEDSVINTGEIMELNAIGIEPLVDDRPECYWGVIPQSIREKIKEAVQTHGLLSPRQIAIVLENL